MTTLETTYDTTTTRSIGVLPNDRPRTGSILRSERIKFFSTRSPWWCMALATVTAIGLGMLIAGTSPPGENRLYFTMSGLQFAQIIVMVMATIAITSEYRFGTIRTGFLASPHRGRVLWTKAAMVAVMALVFGEMLAFATFFLAKLVANDDVLVLSGSVAWRQVAGYGVVYALSALIAIAVGALVRQTAGAISLLLVWTLLVESLVVLIPRVGDDITRFLPFNNATLFAADREMTGIVDPLNVWASLGIFATTAIVLMFAATAVIKRRDA